MHMWKERERDLGEMRGAGVLDLTDVPEHGDSVFMVERGVACRHLKDEHPTSPPVTPPQHHPIKQARP